MERKIGQMKISFGMIFSIILIVLFIVFSAYAIQKFLGISTVAQASKSVSYLQGDVDKMWRGSQGSTEKEYSFSKKTNKVCFTDFASPKIGINKNIYDELQQVYFSDENLFFYPVGSGEGFDSAEIKNIDLKKITQNENPFCILNTNGKIKLIIKKDFGEVLVNIERR